MNTYPEAADNETFEPSHEAAYESPQISENARNITVALDAINRHDAGEVAAIELVDLLEDLSAKNPQFAKAATPEGVKKLARLLNRSGYIDEAMNAVAEKLDALFAQIDACELERAELPVLHAQPLADLLGYTRFTAGQLSAAMELVLPQLRKIIEAMVDRERELEEERQNIWGMYPAMRNASLEKKSMSHDTGRVEEEIAILKEKQPLHQDINTLIRCAQIAHRASKLPSDSLVSSEVVEVIGELVRLGTLRSTTMYAKRVEFLESRTALLLEKTRPHESRLENLEKDQRKFASASEADKAKDRTDFERSVASLKKRLELALEKENEKTLQN